MKRINLALILTFFYCTLYGQIQIDLLTLPASPLLEYNSITASRNGSIVLKNKNILGVYTSMDFGQSWTKIDSIGFIQQYRHLKESIIMYEAPNLFYSIENNNLNKLRLDHNFIRTPFNTFNERLYIGYENNILICNEDLDVIETYNLEGVFKDNIISDIAINSSEILVLAVDTIKNERNLFSYNPNVDFLNKIYVDNAATVRFPTHLAINEENQFFYSWGRLVYTGNTSNNEINEHTNDIFDSQRYIFHDNFLYIFDNSKIYRTTISDDIVEEIELVSTFDFSNFQSYSSNGKDIIIGGSNNGYYSLSIENFGKEHIPLNLSLAKVTKFTSAKMNLQLLADNRLIQYCTKDNSWKFVSFDQSKFVTNYDVFETGEIIFLEADNPNSILGSYIKYDGNDFTQIIARNFNQNNEIHFKRSTSVGRDTILLFGGFCAENSFTSGIISNKATDWQPFSWNTCLPYDPNSVILNNHLYLFNRSYHYFDPIAPNIPHRRVLCHTLNLDELTEVTIDLSDDIPYIDASILIQNDGTLYLNPLEQTQGDHPAYISYDLGESFIALEHTTRGSLYDTVLGVILVNNELPHSRLYLLNEDNKLQPLEHNQEIGHIEKIVSTDDGSIYGANTESQVYKIDFKTSTSETFSYETFIYPNPASDYIQVSSDLEYEQYTIYDIAGKVAISGKSSENTIDISSLDAGVYFIAVDKTKMLGKICKMR